MVASSFARLNRTGAWWISKVGAVHCTGVGVQDVGRLGHSGVGARYKPGETGTGTSCAPPLRNARSGQMADRMCQSATNRVFCLVCLVCDTNELARPRRAFHVRASGVYVNIKGTKAGGAGAKRWKSRWRQRRGTACASVHPRCGDLFYPCWRSRRLRHVKQT